MTRTKIVSVTAVDWAEIGPCSEVRTEDGTEVRSPPHQYVILAETLRGQVFIFGRSLKQNRREAEAWAARIAAYGSINPAKWDVWLNVYGSDAYLDEVADMTPLERSA